MKYLIVLISLISFAPSYAQLSDDWFGSYKGELLATNLVGLQTSYHMELKVTQLTDSSYNWIITYGEDSTKQERAYQLNYLGMNLYEMDEKNSILIKVSFHENSLTSVFEVDDNLIHVVYRLGKKGIHFDLTSSNNKTVSGGSTTDSGVSVPAVISYQTIVFQSAFLKKD